MKASDIVKAIAAKEQVAEEVLAAALAKGRAVLLRSPVSGAVLGVGDGLTTKVNANVGTSEDCRSYRDVLEKAQIAARAGADTLMDLSTVGLGDELDFVSGIRAVAEATGLPVGTVPIYEAVRRGMARGRDQAVRLDSSEMLEVVEAQAEAGTSFMAIHVGLTRRTLEVWRASPRNIVSKGGYLTAEYMLISAKENPFYERFPELLAILRRHDVVLNIGSALRSGATRYNDEAQLAELRLAGELAATASAAGVQVVIEGPGHVPLAEVKEIVQFQRQVTGGRPFFILGFMTTDCFAGWDHIVSAIGAAEAVRHGVSWLCYITPAEHLRMPSGHDVREGVMAARIAAHVGDCARRQPLALERESQRNDKGCLDVRARRQHCSICGQDFCPIHRFHEFRAAHALSPLGAPS